MDPEATHAPPVPFAPPAVAVVAVVVVLLATSACFAFAHSLADHARERSRERWLERARRPSDWSSLARILATPAVMAAASAVGTVHPGAAPYALAVRMLYSAVALAAFASLHTVASGTRGGLVRACLCGHYANRSLVYLGVGQTLLVLPLAALVVAAHDATTGGVFAVCMGGGVCSALLGAWSALVLQRAHSPPLLPPRVLALVTVCAPGMLVQSTFLHLAFAARPWVAESVVAVECSACAVAAALFVGPAFLSGVLSVNSGAAVGSP
jgi:hypothetical protein